MSGAKGISDKLRRIELIIDEDRRRTTHVVVPGALAVLRSARD